MLSHQERMAKVNAAIDLKPPVAAFGGGKFRTPQAAGLSGKQQAIKEEAFVEVREAFRRVAEVHVGARKSTMQTRQPKDFESLASKISRNRKLGSKQFALDEAHASELYHQRRRIASSGSLTERRKNKLDPALYPVVLMRNYRHASASDLMDAEYQRRAGLTPRPQSARPSTRSASAAAQQPGTQSAGMGPGAADPAMQPANAAARATGAAMRPSSSSGAEKRRSASARSASARGGKVASAGDSSPAPAFGDVSLGKPTRDVAVLRRRLLEQIVDRRLFREAELRPFLQAVVRGNKQIEPALLKEAVRDVEREFYLMP